MKQMNKKSVAIGVGITLGTLFIGSKVFKFFFNGKDKKPSTLEDVFEKKTFKGIRNEGTTCYLNSVVQLFFHIPFFRRIVFHCTSSEGEIVYELQRLFFQLQKDDSSTYVSTRRLSKSFGWSESDNHIQHDVQELITLLLEAIQDSFEEQPDEDFPFEEALNFLFSFHQKSQITLLDDPSFKSEKMEAVMALQLPVRACHSLDGSLFKYCDSEYLTGDNKYRVEDDLFEAKKTLSFETLPPILMVHLKRFVYDIKRGGPKKVVDRLEYPSTLNMSEYLPSDAENTTFSLKTVLVHEGVSTKSGHYYVYIKIDGEWWRFNDSVVKKVDEFSATARNFGGMTNPSHAYMLVYVKDAVGEMVNEEVKLTRRMAKKFDESCIIM